MLPGARTGRSGYEGMDGNFWLILSEFSHPHSLPSSVSFHPNIWIPSHLVSDIKMKVINENEWREK